MLDSGLPPATSEQKNIKFGSIVIKTEKPTQSYADAEKALKSLEKAAQDKVFTENEPRE